MNFRRYYIPGSAVFITQVVQGREPVFRSSQKEYKKLIGLSPSQSMKLWQKRFWDHIIRDDRDFENHLHYMHFNPAKHGYVNDPRDWKDSSYIEWEKRGLYPESFTWEEPKDIEWGE
jgi:REP element-mobilizing transposase RayT